MSLLLNNLYRFDDFVLDPANRSLARNGTPIPLSAKSCQVLTYLVANPGRVVTKDELLKAVWPESFVEESNLPGYISGLRKALTDRAGFITTVPGLGYKFTATVEAEAPPDARPQPIAANLEMQQMRETTRVVIRETSTPFGSEELALLPSPQTLHKRRLAYAAGALAAMALAIWLGWRWMDRTVPGDHHEVVVADFENTTGDPDFDKALNVALAVELKQSPYLLLASTAKRQETLKLMERSPQEAFTPALAREVCQRIGDQAVLNPAIARVGKKYLLTLTAVDCDSGEDLILSKSVADDQDSILQSLDSIASSMRRRLGEPLSTLRNTSRPLLPKNTNSLDALKAYTLAHDLAVQGKFEQSVPLFQKALELDPGFAMAYSDLGTIYSNLGEHGLAVKNLSKAYELRESAVQQDNLAIVAIYHSFVTGDIHESIRNYETWAELYPHASAPRANIASEQAQIGRDDLVIEPARQALELAPMDTSGYLILARARMHLGQFDEAKATCQRAIALKVDDAFIHGLMFEIAFAQHNQEDANAQMIWAKGTSAEPYLLLKHALAEYSQGKAHDADADMATLVDGYTKQGLTERANRLLGGMPRLELQLGRLDEARKRLAALPPLEGSTDIPVALALTGEVGPADVILQHEMQLHPTDTLWQDVSGPQIRAAVAIAQNKPDVAIQSLQKSLPYDLRNYDIPTLRGQAYLLAKQPDLAESEFHKIIDHPGVEPLSSNLAVAHLGLARAYALQGRRPESQKEYETFFSLWKQADADSPLLHQARAEFNHL
jgi:DNA-binding winged helix-turn-helix (wHTH) protein/tetratricopeptide (TPR) repeat protein